MSFSRAKPAGFAPGDRLLSTQIEAIDVNQSRGLDTYAGGTYATNAGQTIGITTHVSLTDLAGTIKSGYTLTVMPGAYIVCPGFLNISSGGLQQVQSGGEVEIEGGAEVNVEAGGEINLATGGILYGIAGSIVDFEGQFTSDNMVACHVMTGEQLTVDAGGTLYVAATGELRLWGELNVKNTGQIDLESGSELNLLSGCQMNVADPTDIVATTYTRSFYLTPLGGSANGLYAFNVVSAFGTNLAWAQSGTGAGDHFQVGLYGISRRATVTAVVAHCKAAGGHGGLPGTPPNVRFGQLNVTTGVITNIGSAADPSGTVGAYQAYHTIPISGLTQSLYTSNPYVVSVKGESGANALAGFEVYSIELVCTFTAIENG
jgi:hypothetical protein